MTALACLPDLEPHMPLKLKGILMDFGIDQRSYGQAIIQTAGLAKDRPLSLTAVVDLVTHNIWPKLTPREDIVRQTAALLQANGVSAGLIAEAFELDPTDSHRYHQPKNSHRQGKRAEPEIDSVETEMLTQHAKKQFALFRDPFIDDVQAPDDVFLSADQRYIREVLFATARHGGFVAVCGESGSGKTTLRRDMLDRIQRENLPVIAVQPRCIDKGVLTAGSICHAIIDDLHPGAKVPRSLEAQARAVERLLTESSRAGNSHVLIIEEAHDLNIQTLKYLKRFWELEDGFKKLLAIILIGQPELKDKLDERRNFEAREVIRRCEIAQLMPLDTVLEDYLRLKFKRVGADYSAIFSADAADGIRSHLTRAGKTPRDSISMVYPLTVNRLVIRALNLAAELGQPRIDAAIVKEI